MIILKHFYRNVVQRLQSVILVSIMCLEKLRMHKYILFEHKWKKKWKPAELRSGEENHTIRGDLYFYATKTKGVEEAIKNENKRLRSHNA